MSAISRMVGIVYTDYNICHDDPSVARDGGSKQASLTRVDKPGMIDTSSF